VLEYKYTIKGEPSLVKLTQGEFNSIRSQYLSNKIVPASASIRLGILMGKEIIGAIAFNRENYGVDGAYLLTDFSIRPTIYKRLSKLVLVMTLSKEVQEILSQTFSSRILNISTTAFTNNSVSMKYRGLYELYGRKDGFVNYVGKAGKWTMKEGLEWWKQKYGQILND